MMQSLYVVQGQQRISIRLILPILCDAFLELRGETKGQGYDRELVLLRIVGLVNATMSLLLPLLLLLPAGNSTTPVKPINGT